MKRSQSDPSTKRKRRWQRLLEAEQRCRKQAETELHTGEFDPDFPQTGMRRVWRLVGGPFQYHDTLKPMRAYEGYVSLDDYKDWILAWSPDTELGVQQPIVRADVNERGPMWQFHQAFQGSDNRTYTWSSHLV